MSFNAEREWPPIPQAPQAAPDAPGGWSPAPPARPAPATTPHAGRLRALIAVPLALLLIAVVLLGAYKVTNSGAHVTLYTVQTQTLTSYVGGGGLVYLQQTVALTVPVTAPITSVAVQVGQHVRADDPLVTLDNAALQAALRQAQDQWTAARSNVQALEAQGATAQALAVAERQAADARSRADALRLQLSVPGLSQGVLIAPFAGVVTAVSALSGALAQAGGPPLVTLQDDSAPIVRAQFALEQRNQVYVGAPAQVTPSTTSDLSFDGVVVFVNPALPNPGIATFEAWIALAAPAPQLFASESVYARVRQQEQLPAVPELSVINPDGDAIVFIYADGRAHIRPVVVGPRDEERFGILSGVEAGDQVILLGQYALTDNQPVIPTNNQS
jgi:RND family efflux transporter MFP subunit